jgi:hypothetical protein
MRGSKIVPVRFPESELRRLDVLVTTLGLSRSGVIRLALDRLGEGAYHTGSAGSHATTNAPAGEVESRPPPPVTPSPAPSSPVAVRPHLQKSALDDMDEIEKLLAELE